MEKEKNILDSAAYKRNPFLTPDNYFSDFSKNLENKILMDSQKKVSLFVKLKPWMYIAASFLIFTGGLQWYITGMTGIEKNSVENVEEAEPASAEAAMLYAYSYFDDLMIMDYLVSDNE